MSTARLPDQVLIEQVKLLHGAAFAIPVNGLAALVVVAVLWDAIPFIFLLAWLAISWIVVALRLALCRRYRAGKGGDALSEARLFTAGAVASGLIWAMLCAILPSFAQEREFFFLAAIAAGMTAGGLTSLSAYLPAFVGYVVPFVLSLSIACIATLQRDFVGIGLLMGAYLSVIIGAAASANKSTRRSLVLQIANAALNDSLFSTRTELDATRKAQWSTLGHLSHELKTPLNAILGFSETMREQIFGALGHPKYLEYATYVHRSGEHLLALVNEILDLSQGEAGMLTLRESEVDLVRLVEHCIALIRPRAEAKQQHINWAPGVGSGRLRGDETKLRQILLNLLSNATKFTPPGGAITVTLGQAPNGGTVLSVADTGIGMDPADIPRAMLPFVRLATPLTQETDGVGLGLSLCKRLADLHGAAFTVTSASGEGTLCRLVFPAAALSPPSGHGISDRVNKPITRLRA
ncbi:MAG: sensor histidine kinase [Rhodospirillales bacterium]|nr:sensor histidine kinase [Rhodospirillales bacterium]